MKPKAIDSAVFVLGDYRPVASEHNEQSTFFDWLLRDVSRNYPEVHPLFFAVPNGAHLAGDKSQRARAMAFLKEEGFTPGVADTLFLSGRGGFLGLALEFKKTTEKANRDGGLREGQREFLHAARLEGYQAAVAYGFEEAEKIVTNYLNMPKTQDMVWQALKAAERGDLEACKNALKQITLSW